MKKRFIIILVITSLALLCGVVYLVKQNQEQRTRIPKEEPVTLTAHQREELKAYINRYDQEMPCRFGTFGILKHFVLKGQHLRMFVELNPQFYILKGISEEPDIVKRDLFLNLCNLDDSLDPLFLRLAQNRIGLRMELGKEAVEDILEIYFTADELLKVAQSKQKDVNPHELLQSHVEVYNLSLPMKIKKRLTLNSVELTTDHLIFNHTVKEVQGNEMNRIRAGKQKWGHDLMHTLRNSKSPAVQEVMHLCRQAKLGMKYRYTGDKSDQQVTLYFDRKMI